MGGDGLESTGVRLALDGWSGSSSNGGEAGVDPRVHGFTCLGGGSSRLVVSSHMCVNICVNDLLSEWTDVVLSC